MRLRRWWAMRFGTRKSWHPWGRAELCRRAWWDRSLTFHVAASSYAEARRMLDARMDSEFAEAQR